MTSEMTSKTVLTMRIGRVGLGWLDSLAHTHRLPRAEVIRAALIVARRHETETIAILKEKS
jgi:hypothetical protein